MAVTLDPKSNKLIIRFRVKGFDKQFYLSTGLKDNKNNRIIVESRWELIQREISLGEFDSSLERYKFGNKKLIIEIKDEPTLFELWQQFTEFQSNHLEQTTIKGSYKAIENYIKKLPDTNLSAAPKIRDWLTKNTTSFMAWHCLLKFSQCCTWGVESGLIAANPFITIQLPKPKRKSDKEDFQAFTLEQRDIIIQAFEDHERLYHHAALIKFLFWCGCRPGEAFALTWGDISEDCTKISITKSKNLHGIAKGTKNGKRRIFPCSVDSKLQKLLIALRPPNPLAGDLIFLSKNGLRMNGTILNNVWNRNADFLGVVRELANDGKIPYLKPYATRHTFASWAIASGSTPDKVAYWIGDTVQTVLKYYCHPEVTRADCPDF